MGSAPHPLNQILYGPPGTGKTWKTVAMAVAIAEREAVKDVEREDRKEVKRRFEELRKSGQVDMVTFHQNYAYEDFVEGIRPVVEGDGKEDADGGLKYKLRPGVFRVLAEKANDSWDVKEVLNGFLQWIEEETRKGPIQLTQNEELPEILEAPRYKSSQFRSVRYRLPNNQEQGVSVEALLKNYPKIHEGSIKKPDDIPPMQRSKRDALGTKEGCYLCLRRLKQYHEDNWQLFLRVNYVLIIDEINRGNIARIFGELITLVEESRRIGEEDETRVKLPYSGTEFGVPKNLYIVGTMNTADRSIALLDTALRRRFEFVEMMPQWDHADISENAEEVNVRELLRAMNERIRVLLDRERQIGHTYFLGVDSIKSLKKVFQNRIAPLLQEYFYDDWEKMDLVLNRNGFVKKLDVPKEPKELNDAADTDRKAYELRSFEDAKWNEPERYRKIYSGKAEQDSEGGSGQA